MLLREAHAPFPTFSNLFFIHTSQPWAFEAREFLRALCVGKEAAFTSLHSLPPGQDDTARDVGTAELAPPAAGAPPVDVASELLRAGWAKVKEPTKTREPTDEDVRRRDLEAEARAAGRGMWNPEGPKVRQVALIDSEGKGEYRC